MKEQAATMRALEAVGVSPALQAGMSVMTKGVATKMRAMR